MLKTVGCGKQQEATAPIHSVSGKTAVLVSKFEVEDLPSAELQPMFPGLAAKNLPLGRKH